LAPLANLFDEVLATIVASNIDAGLSAFAVAVELSALTLPRDKVEGPPGAWCNRVEGLSAIGPASASLIIHLEELSESSLPRVRVEAPPGAWCSRVVGRSVIVFPQFWLAPSANLFEETPWVFKGSSASPPKQIVASPPGDRRSLDGVGAA